MLKRAAELYRPFGHLPALPMGKKPANSKQTEMLTDHRSIERKDVNSQTK